MGRIADYLELITLDVARRPVRPKFVRLKEQTRSDPHTAAATPGDGTRRGNSATLGIMPDYAYEQKDGLKITDVRPGGPADTAGLKGGDRIVRCGSKAVGTIYDYMEIMSHQEPGQKLEVCVVRDGKEVKLDVTLESRRPE
jgi:S1-C subfamily serine protease